MTRYRLTLANDDIPGYTFPNETITWGIYNATTGEWMGAYTTTRKQLWKGAPMQPLSDFITT